MIGAALVHAGVHGPPRTSQTTTPASCLSEGRCYDCPSFRPTRKSPATLVPGGVPGLSGSARREHHADPVGR